MFARLGPWCHDHRWKVVIGWVVLLFAANGIAGAVGEAYRQDFSLNGFESTDGFALVESEFHDGSGSPQFGQIVFEAEQGVTDPEVQAAMEEPSRRSPRSTTSHRCRAPTPPVGSSRSRRRVKRPGRSRSPS